MAFTQAAATHPDFARELPRFVSEVRCLFTADEIAVHLARLERAQIETAIDVAAAGDIVEEDELFTESPAGAAERVRQFTLIKELLTAPALGMS
jgi:hypothetical protein